MKILSKNLTMKLLAICVVTSLLVFFNSCKKNLSDPLVLKSNNAGPRTLLTTLSIPSTISDSLIAFWTFAKTTYDLSGNLNIGTAYNVTAIADRQGHGAGAYNFNGTSSYVEIPDKVSLRLANTDFTINAWVKLTAYNTSFGSIILSKRTSGLNNGYGWSITGDSATTKYVQSFGPGGAGLNAFGTDTIGLNTWHMVTAIYTLSTQVLKFYKDGVLDDSTAHILSPNALISTQLYIGKDNPAAGSTGYYFKGAIGDIRMYNRAITISEIATLYNATTAPTAGLLAFWPLTHTALDLSGNNNNGTSTAVSVVTDRFGNSKGAYRFNGTSSYIVVPDTMALRLNNTNFSLNAWVRLISYNSSYGSTILNKHIAGNNNGWAWSITGDSALTKHVQAFGPGGTSAEAYGATVVTTATWHMVTCVYNLSSTTVKFYIDGVLDTTVTGIPSPNALITAELYIGRDNPSSSANGYFFNGSMNDVRVYNTALTTIQINQLLNALD